MGGCKGLIEIPRKLKPVNRMWLFSTVVIMLEEEICRVNIRVKLNIGRENIIKLLFFVNDML